MKISIRLKIVLPLIVLLVLLPFTIWKIFSWQCDNYMNESACEQMQNCTSKIQTYIDSNGDSNSYNNKKLLELTTGMGTQVIIVSGSDKNIYPSALENQENAELIYNYYISNLSANKDDENTTLENFMEITIDNQKFYLSYEKLDSDDDTHTQYIIVYQQISNLVNVINMSGGMVFRVALLYSVVFLLIMLILMAPVISGIDRQCEHAQRIGNGEFNILEDNSRIKEISRLNASMNLMAQRIKESDDTQKMFFQNASHELRTPITSISGYAQGIKCNTFSSDQAADVILSESERLTVLINDILLLSKMDSHNQDSKYERICAEEFVHDCKAEFAGFAELSGIELNVEQIQNKETYLVADGKLLMQAVSNILANGFRYAKHKITFSLEETPEYVNLCIANDGQPFSEEDQIHMFERFYKGKGGQYGIGLSIAKTAIEYMGGRIEAKNTEDGVCFIISLVSYANIESTAGRTLLNCDSSRIKQVILKELQEINPSIAYEEESKILEDEIISPYEMVLFLFRLNEIFDVDITSAEIQPCNFNTVDGMVHLIEHMTNKDN